MSEYKWCGVEREMFLAAEFENGLHNGHDPNPDNGPIVTPTEVVADPDTLDEQ